MITHKSNLVKKKQQHNLHEQNFFSTATLHMVSVPILQIGKTLEKLPGSVWRGGPPAHYGTGVL